MQHYSASLIVQIKIRFGGGELMERVKNEIKSAAFQKLLTNYHLSPFFPFLLSNEILAVKGAEMRFGDIVSTTCQKC